MFRSEFFRRIQRPKQYSVKERDKMSLDDCEILYGEMEIEW